jgi:hypothetical protein
MGAERLAQTQANVLVELQFTANREHADPFNDVTLDVLFTDPGGHEARVPAFWAGKSLWKVRYVSPLPGTHAYRTECSDRQDSGLQGAAGKIEIKPYTGQNPLYLHGPLHVSSDRRYLQHADKTPFFWLGDTWWMGLCHRIHWPDEFQKLAADRKEKGFNVIQIVAGLYPDMHPFDPRGANEAGYPWQTNYTSIRPEYFDAADQRLRYLVDQGFTSCIVGAWGYFMPWMGVEKMKAHWRYLVARYGAMPVVWCIAGEANLPWYLAKGFPYDDREQVRNWTEVMRYVRDIDPFHRPITIHPTAIKFYTARHATDDAALLDFDMLQTPHGQREAVPTTIRAVRESYAATPTMPVIDGEASYEMLSDSLPTEWTRRMFWLCMMNGAVGHTYGANGIWQCNRREQPHGASPHGGNYGKISWDDAMNLPGSSQLGFGKKLLAQYPWQQFRPHPEWATFKTDPSLSLDKSEWIWFPEGNPAQNAPTEKRFFRKSFELPDGKKIQRARLRVSADDWFSARVNGTTLGSSGDWHSGKQFNDIARLLKPGKNVLAITAENRNSNVPNNPAGLIAALEIQFVGAEPLTLVSDNSWLSSKSESAGWESTAFDDSSWTKALVSGHYGDAPWGRFAVPNDGAYGPQSTGIAESVRIIYVPDPDPIELHKLTGRTVYFARYFDPVTGGTTPLGSIQADDNGSRICPPPRGNDHDWVLVLESRSPSRREDRQ